MKKTLIFYYPNGGNVETSVQLIHDQFPGSELVYLEDLKMQQVIDSDFIIVGSSTVGAENWHEATASNKWALLFLELKKQNISLKDKKIALFGLGDQILYPDHFVDGMAVLKEEFSMRGAEMVGRWPVAGYTFTDSESLDGDHFLGLALDEDQQEHLTPERIVAWSKKVKKEAGIA